MNTIILRVFVLVLCLGFGASTYSAPVDTLSVSDYLEFEQVRDPQISPDGSRIVYTRRWVNQQTDRWESALWLMDADGSRQRFLLKGSQARWSPAGDRILFSASDDNGKPQIFVRWMDDEGAVTQVTRMQQSQKSPVWSPDGRSIAFVAVVPEETGWELDLPAAPEGAQWTPAPKVLNDLFYRQDKVGYMEPGFSHLFVVPADAGTAKQLTHGRWNVGARRSPEGLFDGAGLSWTPDGEQIVFDGLMKSDTQLEYRRSNIYTVDLAGKKVTRLTNDAGNWTEPVVSPDGKRIVYEGHPASDVTYVVPRLFTMSIDGADARLLNEDFEQPVVGDKHWSSDGREIYFSAQDRGYISLFSMTLKGSFERGSGSKEVFGLSSVSADGNFAVGVRSNFDEPGDVFGLSLKGNNAAVRLTQVNRDLLEGKQLGQTEEIWFEAEDGQPAHGWIVRPPGFDSEKNYPLLMEVHGGPFAMYQGRFNLSYQIYAANGYVVLFTNPRGSTGYGEAFSQAINHAYPSVDYLDLMAGVDAAVAGGNIDENRLYIGGCSGGGVLTSWVIGHTNRFAAASVRCPVTNWISMLGQTDIPNFTLSFFKKPFWQDPTDWLRHSPIMYVGNVTTPTIVMTGEQDLRTPMAQSEEYFAALKIEGVPAKLIRFNDQYHGTSTHPSNAMRTMAYLMSWYNQYDLEGERVP